MASLQELGLEIYIFILCVNAGILVVDASIDTPLITPFDGIVDIFCNAYPKIIVCYNFGRFMRKGKK